MRKDEAIYNEWNAITEFRLFEDEDPAAQRNSAPSSAVEPTPTPGAEDLVPEQLACRDCRATYDPGNPDEVKLHTEPVNCGQSCRCVGRPRCYTCGGSFCMCAAH
ncbi:hypothetical protein [Streptomyces sp. NL15-2K]|uniref:hypothetical protein n=1 Tax=Streptomyces sp. NL15-2K TaxID=376149 RepID=UPI000F56E00E|nr:MULTISPECIES: hypothetical protein [Actinomycetes]WKX08090.1 hypothetical protein Q4V64_11625 [Kutzneria buriramensis]GCB50455.1 hypothetical protein SNL152K_7799 [Streptomyces sp. NL15-2K]